MGSRVEVALWDALADPGDTWIIGVGIPSAPGTDHLEGRPLRVLPEERPSCTICLRGRPPASRPPPSTPTHHVFPRVGEIIIDTIRKKKLILIRPYRSIHTIVGSRSLFVWPEADLKPSHSNSMHRPYGLLIRRVPGSDDRVIHLAIVVNDREPDETLIQIHRAQNGFEVGRIRRNAAYGPERVPGRPMARGDVAGRHVESSSTAGAFEIGVRAAARS